MSSLSKAGNRKHDQNANTQAGNEAFKWNLLRRCGTVTYLNRQANMEKVNSLLFIIGSKWEQPGRKVANSGGKNLGRGDWWTGEELSPEGHRQSCGSVVIVWFWATKPLFTNTSSSHYLTGVCAAVITHKHTYVLKHGAKRIH